MLLTRTALAALKRIASGRPAFSSVIPSGRGAVRLRLVENRRAAITALYRLRYVTRGKWGPAVTQTGKDAIATHDRLAAARRAARPYARVLEPVTGATVDGIAERLGISRGTVTWRARGDGNVLRN